MAEVGGSGRRSSPARVWLVAVLLLGCHGGLAVCSLWHKGVTVDELTHLPAGLAAVTTGEVRLNPQHPPLAKLLAGSSASLARPALPLAGQAYQDGREWRFGYQVLFESGNDELLLLRLGRLPTVLLSVLCGLVVFWWARLRHDDLAGLCCLGLYAFSPTVLAHARWVTTDLPVAAAGTLTLFLWWLWRAQLVSSLPRQVAVGLVLGLALAMKFSALLLLPAIAGIALLDRRQRPQLRAWLVMAAVVALVLSLVYLRWDGLLQYLEGVKRVNVDHQPGYEYYLGGRFSPHGFVHYFLVAFLVKSALPGLVAMVLGLVAALRWRTAWQDDLYLWFPVLLWFVAMSWRADNIGVRYLLPVYPLLAVLAGTVVRAPAGSRRPVRIGLVVLVLLQAVVAVAAFPSYLSFFNRAVGGPTGGLAWLDDSNVDWGQDLRLVAPQLADLGERDCWVAPFFPAELPTSFGITCRTMGPDDWLDPAPGVYVVSAHLLIRARHWCATNGASCDWLQRYTPTSRIGGGLYRFDLGEVKLEQGNEVQTPVTGG